MGFFKNENRPTDIENDRPPFSINYGSNMSGFLH